MKEIVIRIQVPDGLELPDVDYEVSDVPQEPAYLAEMPPVTAAPQSAPTCPQHGAMTFHPAKDKPDGKHVSARYSCDVKVNNAYCPTKAIWL